MGRSKIDSEDEEEEFDSEATESGTDSDDSLLLSEENESGSDQDSRANRVLSKSPVGKNNEKSLCNKTRRSVPRRASAAKVSYNIPDSDEEEENESPPLSSPPKKKVKKEEGRHGQPGEERKQNLKFQNVQQQQPAGSNDKASTAGATTISVPLKNADKLAVIMAKAQKAKHEEETTLTENKMVTNTNGDTSRSERGKDDRSKKKKKDKSSLPADAEKEDVEWSGESASEDEDEEEDFVSEDEAPKKVTAAQKRNSTSRGSGGMKRAKSNNAPSKIIIRDGTEDEIEKKFQHLKDKLTRSIKEYEAKFEAGGTTPSLCS